MTQILVLANQLAMNLGAGGGGGEGQAGEQAGLSPFQLRQRSVQGVTDAGWPRNPKAECNGEVCKVDRVGPPSQARGRTDLVPKWASRICEAGRGSLPGRPQPLM